MKLFLIKIALFAILPLASVVVFYGYNRDFIAASKITNSYSFNEKIRWLPAPHKIDIMAFGSSVSQNNLSSEAITAGFGTSSYLNVSSWGLKITDMQALLPVFIELYHPDIVICASDIIDFESPSIKYAPEEVKEAILTKPRPNILHLLSRYSLARTLANRTNRRSRTAYSSVHFDNWGGVPFADSGFQVEPSRWNKQSNFDQIDDRNYEALLKVSDYLQSHDIDFIFVQTPIRSSLQDAPYIKNISQHMTKIKEAVEKNAHLVVDLSTTTLPDSDFTDSTHLNTRGATELTRTMIAAYKDYSRDRPQ